MNPIVSFCRLDGPALGTIVRALKANASKHKAMSYERMEKRAAELEAEVAKCEIMGR